MTTRGAVHRMDDRGRWVSPQRHLSRCEAHENHEHDEEENGRRQRTSLHQWLDEKTDQKYDEDGERLAEEIESRKKGRQ